MSERRYQAQLCLVQVAVPDDQGEDGVRTEVLDPIADELDPAPLAEVLADPEVEVIMHAGRQDVAILRRTWDTAITSVFDTQVAAGFLGFGNQEGYEQLVRRVLGVRLRGGEGFTRWDKRPLTDKQIAYAADDARCLLALGSALERQLEERGRAEWAREESRLVEASDDVRSPRRPTSGCPSSAGWTTRAARWPCAWPSGATRWRASWTARRPRCCPTRCWSSWPGARRRTGRRWTTSAGCPSRPSTGAARSWWSRSPSGARRSRPLPRPPPPKRDSSEAPLVSLAQAVVRQRSRESGVATELIATQSELTALVGAVRRDRTATACARWPAGGASWWARSCAT